MGFFFYECLRTEPMPAYFVSLTHGGFPVPDTSRTGLDKTGSSHCVGLTFLFSKPLESTHWASVIPLKTMRVTGFF